MEWVKKNPVIVAGTSVAVVLLGLAVWFLAAKMSASSEAELKLAGSLDSRTALWQGKPFPSAENIEAIQKDQERVKKFMDGLHSVIPQMPPPSNLDDRGLKTLLEQAIADLFLSATNSKTTIQPPNYSFSFAAIRKKLTFRTNTYDTIAVQLADVKMLLNILFDSKINTLEGIRRSSLTMDDERGGTDYIFLNPQTNQFSIITPYEIQFRCFGSELEHVIQSLVSASNCIVIKNINISPRGFTQQNQAVLDLIRDAAAAGSVSVGASQVAAVVKPVLDTSTEAGRYGNPRASRPPSFAPAPANLGIGDTNKPITVLAEKPLRISILLDIVRTPRPSK